MHQRVGEQTEWWVLPWQRRAKGLRHSGWQTQCFQMPLSRSLPCGREKAGSSHVIQGFWTQRSWSHVAANTHIQGLVLRHQVLCQPQVLCCVLQWSSASWLAPLQGGQGHCPLHPSLPFSWLFSLGPQQTLSFSKTSSNDHLPPRHCGRWPKTPWSMIIWSSF
jgi:hypothetical protein